MLSRAGWGNGNSWLVYFTVLTLGSEGQALKRTLSLLPRPPPRPPLPGRRRNLGLGSGGHPSTPQRGAARSDWFPNSEEPGELVFQLLDAAFDSGRPAELFGG